MMTYWVKFEQQRIQHGWSLREVGRRAGVAPGYLSELRSGVKVAPAAGVVRQLADAFGCTVDELAAPQ